MSTNYGLAGTNPFRDFVNGPTKLIADWLYDNYDAAITEVQLDQVLWNQPYSGDGDFTIWFQRINSFHEYEDLPNNIENVDYYIYIHIFVRAFSEEYHNVTTGRKSAEYFMDRFERWIRKTINSNKLALMNEGILKLSVIESRDSPVDSSVNRDVPQEEYDYHEIEVDRRLILLELKTQHIFTPLS